MSNLAQLTPTLFLILKIATLVFLALYTIFAVVVIKQVKLMSATIQITSDKYIQYIAYGHLVVVLLVFLLALVIL